MRAHRGFTLIELMVVVAITAIVAGVVVWQGRSARQAAGIAGGAYELAIRMGGLKARAMADGREYVLVVADAADPLACRDRESACGRIAVLRNPVPAFTVESFSPEPPIVGAEWVDDGATAFLPRNSRLDLDATWTAPPPFSTVTAFDPAILLTCAGGRRCFGIRFRPDGEVRPVMAAGTPVPAGFAFVLRPFDAPSGAAERRAIFVSFPAGLVKTAAF
jgi:prepilin-type N-terminal cleavage/methylation domain-containing protein